MSFLETIAVKRDRGVNTAEQLQNLAQRAGNGSIPDYQLSAWLMAAFLNGLNDQETADLTLAMARSGERLDLSNLPRPWVDKHSTGGVGDKTSLVVLPILAACGLTMVKMSGRGLGITGGTIDKLESIPGFRTDLTPEEMVAQAGQIGLALGGQTPRLAPADKALYSLRDVTGTVANTSLITASILSKKIAGGAETVILDVKCGRGAFMENLVSAEQLADSLVGIGKLCGLNVSAVITEMDQPLGCAVGNSLEILEAVKVLKPDYLSSIQGSGAMAKEPTSRFLDLCLTLAGHALEVVNRGDRTVAEECVRSGGAFAKFKEWMHAQGSSVDWNANKPLPESKTIARVTYSGEPGWVSEVDARIVGEVVLELGGGRKEKTDTIDHSVGIEVCTMVGLAVAPGDEIFRIHAKSDADAAQVQSKLQASIRVSPTPVAQRHPVIKSVH